MQAANSCITLQSQQGSRRNCRCSQKRKRYNRMQIVHCPHMLRTLQQSKLMHQAHTMANSDAKAEDNICLPELAESLQSGWHLLQ